MASSMVLGSPGLHQGLLDRWACFLRFGPMQKKIQKRSPLPTSFEYRKWDYSIFAVIDAGPMGGGWW